MQISSGIPVVGLVIILFNVLIAAVRPHYPPRLMGVELFLCGMTTLVISVVDLINPIGLVEFERTLLFVAGCINCSVGYYMVLREIQKQGV